MLAARRAVANEETGNIINDPYAKYFIDDAVRRFARETNTFIHYVLMRHQILEDHLILNSGYFDQILILGAGFDTKAQRYPRLTERIVEVDSPEMITFKQSILREKRLPMARSVPGKLESLADLEGVLNHLDLGKRTAVVCEGFFMYFDKTVVFNLLDLIMDRVKNLAYMGLDMLSPSYLKVEKNLKVHERLSNSEEHVKSYFTDEELISYFKSKGFETMTWYPSKLQRHYYESEWKGNNDKFVLCAWANDFPGILASKSRRNLNLFGLD